ncbi:LysR family transcriptional regulator [Ahniella affigens]|uniref:LysR family transcriptional regulator n=1 Tax=Ahniella affigens TaxID=2021234 RepID=A0A2P1PNK6_9GAMM|nr:LysR family transcriptional regulator [Ahniella affigens]AVP96407.1 LysR family transcriptional regulator [Ahniella affigens]
MNQLEAMRIFVRVAELGSFTQAAERIGLPKASVSASVQQLEQAVGARLLHRTTRKVQLTQDGRAYYERCLDLLAEFGDLQSMFEREGAGLTGRIRCDMSAGMARNMVIPRLPEFLNSHPNLDIELSSTDRRVDLIREGFDCVVRVGQIVDDTLIARPLGAFPILNCASPAYVRAHGHPESLADLVHHQLIHYVPVLGSKSEGFEYVDPDRGTVHVIDLPGRITVNNSEAYLAACLAGFGIIQAPDTGVRDLIASGQLVELLPTYRAAPMEVNLLYVQRRHVSKRVLAFMNWLASVLTPALLPVSQLN